MAAEKIVLAALPMAVDSIHKKLHNQRAACKNHYLTIIL
jgi:hypothetical protein